MLRMPRPSGREGWITAYSNVGGCKVGGNRGRGWGLMLYSPFSGVDAVINYSQRRWPLFPARRRAGIHLFGGG